MVKEALAVDRALVQVQIYLRRMIPAEIGGHAGNLHGSPCLLVMTEQEAGALDDMQHLMGIVIAEGEAGAFTGKLE